MADAFVHPASVSATTLTEAQAAASSGPYTAGQPGNDSAVTLAASQKDETLPSPEKTLLLAAHTSALGAWSQVASAFLLNAIAWGTLSMFGVYELYYTQTLGLPSGTVSWVGSLQTFLTYLVSTVSGQLSDAGYAIPTAIVGTALVVSGGVWTSFAGASLGMLFASQAVITGVGLGLLSTPALPSIGAVFGPNTPRGHQRTLALAVSTIGTSAGGAVLPAVVQYLLPAIGFAWAVRCAALVALIICAVATFLIRPLPTVKAAKSAPASTSKAASLLAFLGQMADLKALREGPFALFLVSTFFMYWGLYYGFYYINAYAEQVIGFSTNQATLLLIISTIAGIPARLGSGLLAGCSLGALDSLVIMTTFMAITIFCWLAVGTSVAGMYAFVIFFGLGNGATQGVWLGAIAELMPEPSSSASGSAMAESSESSDSSDAGPSRIGARFGMSCTVAAFATLAGPPTAAALIAQAGNGDAASDYRGASIWAAAVTLVSAVITAAARVRVVGWRLRPNKTATMSAA